VSEFAPDELLTVAASRVLTDGTTTFVGIGPPGAAANLAQRTHAPNLILVYESGAIGAKPRRLPLSIGDDDLAETADELVSVPEMFNYWVGGGRIDVGFLGAAQIDRRGNINTTVIGDYAKPKVRLPGAGGAPEIAARAREVIVLVRHSKRVFVEKIDFVTSVGPAGAPFVVITDLGVLRLSAEGELQLTAVHAGVDVDQVREATGWDLSVVDDLQQTAPPSDEELETLRALRASAERAPGAA
jgi:glutaconate CoA-transferase subunit B